MWVDVSKFGHIWAMMGRSGRVKLIGRGWVIYLVGGCVYAYRSRVRCGWMWASLSIYRHR